MLKQLITRFMPFLPYIEAALVVAALVADYQLGSYIANQKRLAEVAQLKADYAQQVADANKRTADAQADMRAQEQQHAQNIAAIDAQYLQELNDEKRKADSTIAALRAGSLRVQDRFKCPATSTTTSSTSTHGTSASMGDAASAGGLRTDDAEFLLRVGQRANAVKVQLQACQAIVRDDRKVP